jgi:hypothetical protein
MSEGGELRSPMSEGGELRVGDRPGSSIKKIIKLKMWFLFFGDLLTG